MVRIELKHIHIRAVTLATGERVEYHSIRGVPKSRFWRTGDSEVGSQDYVAAYQAAKRRPVVGETFDAVVTAYLDSGEFRGLAPRTQRDYRIWCDRIRDKFGDAPKAALESPKIRNIAMAWRDQWSGKQAQYGWTVLRRIVSWAYDRRLLTHHHLRGGRVAYKSDRSEIIWTAADIAAFVSTAPDWLAAAVVLASETGLRKGDLVKLSRAHILPTPGGRQIQVRTNKTGKIATVPVTQAAARVIDATPRDRLLILAAQRGGPLDGEWLSKAVKKHARRIGLDETLRLNDTRGSAVTRLYRAGASVEQLARAFGWTTRTAAEMVERYAQADPEASDDVLRLIERNGRRSV